MRSLDYAVELMLDSNVVGANRALVLRSALFSGKPWRLKGPGGAGFVNRGISCCIGQGDSDMTSRSAP